MKRALEGLPGVSGVRVIPETERALVDHDPRVLSPARMIEAIRRTVVLPASRRAIARITRPRRPPADDAG